MNNVRARFNIVNKHPTRAEMASKEWGANGTGTY